MEVLIHPPLEIGCAECLVAGEHLVEHAAQGIEVGAAIELASRRAEAYSGVSIRVCVWQTVVAASFMAAMPKSPSLGVSCGV